MTQVISRRVLTANEICRDQTYSTFESNNFTFSRAFYLPMKEVKNNREEEEESYKGRKLNLKG